MATRVLAVAQAAEPGGAERALLRLAQRLPEHGFEIELTAPGEGGVADAARAAGIPTHALAVGALRAGAWPRAALSWPRARSLMQRLKPEIVLLNGTIAQRVAPAFAPARLVLALHDVLDVAPRPWGSRRFWRSVPVVLCACDAVAERAADLGAPRDRLRTVYPPVNAVEPAGEPSWAGTPGGGPVIGYVGRIEPMKGTLDLIEAIAVLRRRRPQARLVIVGGKALLGSRGYSRRVRDAAERLGDAVVMAGPSEDARALMPWFDVLAVPSRKEAFGTVAAEALAAGTPAVVTRSGGMCEYVKEGRNGAVVDPGDPDALAAAIERVLDRRGELSEHARQDAARFDGGRVAGEVATAFRDALAVAVPA